MVPLAPPQNEHPKRHRCHVSASEARTFRPSCRATTTDSPSHLATRPPKTPAPSAPAPPAVGKPKWAKTGHVLEGVGCFFVVAARNMLLKGNQNKPSPKRQDEMCKRVHGFEDTGPNHRVPFRFHVATFRWCGATSAVPRSDPRETTRIRKEIKAKEARSRNAVRDRFARRKSRV